MKRRISYGFVLVFAALLAATTACKGVVEHDQQGEVSSVGVKTDPQVTKEVKEAGQQTAEAAKVAGDKAKEGVQEAGQAVATGAQEAGQAVANGAQAAGQAVEKGAENAKENLKETGAAVADATADSRITGAVKTRLLQDPEVKGLLINVDTANAVVTLSGTAETADQRAEAVKLARRTDGVKKVINNITVTGKKG